MTLQPYTSDHPSYAAVEAMRGNVVIEFGVDWCPNCQLAAGPVSVALAAAQAGMDAETSAVAGARAPTGASVAAPAATLQYLRLEDERTRPLGRRFKVKLWPTLLFFRDGVEVARVVRPTTAAEVTAGLKTLGSNREVQPWR